MDSPFHPRRLQQIARWCRNAAWAVAILGLLATSIDLYVSIGEWANASSVPGGNAVLFPLSSLASTLLALVATIFYAIMLLAISGMLDHYAFTQLKSIEAATRSGGE